MNDPKKLVVLKGLTDHLKGITPGNGYQHDLSSGVFRGRQQFGSETPLPAVSILENPRPDHGLDADENGGVRSEDWILLLQGWVQDDYDNPTDPAYRLMADVEQRLGELIAIDNRSGEPQNPSVYMLGGLIAKLRAGPGVCRPPQEGLSERAFFYLPVAVTLAYDTIDPYRLGA